MLWALRAGIPQTRSPTRCSGAWGWLPEDSRSEWAGRPQNSCCYHSLLHGGEAGDPSSQGADSPSPSSGGPARHPSKVLQVEAAVARASCVTGPGGEGCDPESSGLCPGVGGAAVRSVVPHHGPGVPHRGPPGTVPCGHSAHWPQSGLGKGTWPHSKESSVARVHGAALAWGPPGPPSRCEAAPGPQASPSSQPLGLGVCQGHGRPRPARPRRSWHFAREMY